jgi:hypothetical protein
MDRRRAVLRLLLLALLLGPVAGATIVPDPTWIAGVYDDGDGDEVAILLDNTPGIVPVVTIPLLPAGSMLAGTPAVPAFVSRALPRFSSRAPPQA